MVDTARTLAEVLTLLANNTSQAISPQDLRDALLSVATPVPEGGFDNGREERAADHGALGNSSPGGGGADDTAAIQETIDAAVGGPMSGTVPTPTRYGYDGNKGRAAVGAGHFRITDELDFRGIQGLDFGGAGRQATVFVVDGSLEHALRVMGDSHNKFHDFSIVGKNGFGGDGDVVSGIGLDWDPALVSLSTSRNHFENIWVRDLDFKYGFAVGLDSTNLDVSNCKFVNCHASGNIAPGSGNTTLWQAGFLAGSGTSGNILNHYFENCHNLFLRRGYHINAVNNVAIQNSDAGYLDDFVYKVGPGSLAIRDTRIEEASHLAISGGGAGYTSHLLVDNVGWDPGGSGEANGRMIDWGYTGSISIRGLTTGIPTNNSLMQHIRVSVSSGKPVHVRVQGASIGGLTTQADLVEATGSSEVYADYFGVNGIDSSGGLTAQFPAAFIGYNAEARLNPESIRLGSATGPLILTGTGSPESAVTAGKGALYLRDDGGDSTTLYAKTSGTGNTGWKAATFA